MKEKRSALLLLISSMAIFGTIGVFRRNIALSSAAVAMLRGFVGAAALLLFARLRGQHPDRAAIRRNLLPLIVSGAAMGVNWILLFEAYRYTTVAAATLCYYMAPTFIILASPLVLRERLQARKLLCVALALLGMVLVSGVLDAGFSAKELRGAALGLGAAVLYAGVILTNKRMRPIGPYDRTVLQLFFAAVVLLPYLFATEGVFVPRMTGTTLWMLAAVCLIHTALAYALYFSSVERLPAQTLALFSYIDPVVAVLLSALLLHERVTLLTALGAVLVLGAAVLGELPEKQR